MRGQFPTLTGLLAACAGHAASPVAPEPSPPPEPDAAAALDAPPIPTACLPTRDDSTITLLDGDARTIDVCFETDCFAIDRKTNVIVPWSPPVRVPLPPRAGSVPATIVSTDGGTDVDLCARDRGCVTIARRYLDDSVQPSAADVSAPLAVATFGGPPSPDPPTFFIYDEDHPRHGVHLAPADGAPCGHAALVGGFVYIATDDCDGGTGRASLYGPSGHLVAPVGARRNVNTYGAYPMILHDRVAIVAPNAYAIVVVDPVLPQERQPLIDLVPIQASATRTPDFTAVETHGVVLVASPTGGVAVIDPIAARLTSTWIIPSCEEGSR